MLQFRTGLRSLLQHWKPLLLFELLWKLMTLLVLAPACAGLLQLAIRGAGLQYLTNSNLLRFLRSPWTILVLLVLLTLAALYTLFEIAAVCDCLTQPKAQGIRQALRSMAHTGLRSLGHFFTGGSPLLLLYLLVMIPLMQFSASSGIFTAMGIPDFLAYYMTKKQFLPPIYFTCIILCCLLCVTWIFSTVLFTQNRCSFRSARKTSASLVHGRFWRTFWSILLWNLCYLAAVLLFLLAITLVMLGILHFTGSSTLITSRAVRILKLLLRLTLWSFSFFATPICMAHVTALLKKYQSLSPDIPIPTPAVRQSRPFRKWGIALVALCLSAAALTLNLSYVYSVCIGSSSLRLFLYREPVVMAHRGDSAGAPENTLYAFSDAIEDGADYIELDVQQTKDGVLVVLHDQNLKRVTGKNWNIWDVTYAEIQDLDAGSWFDPAYANARIPTLEETLQFVDKRVRLNIEIKPTDHTTDTLEQDVAELIAKYDYTDSCYVTSFSYAALKRIKAANPDIPTGYVMSVAYGQFYQLQYADAFSLNKVFVTTQVVNAAHQAGKEVFAWTVNSVSEVHRLCNLRVDGIITDDPIMVQEVAARESTGETLQSVLDYFLN